MQYNNNLLEKTHSHHKVQYNKFIEMNAVKINILDRI